MGHALRDQPIIAQRRIKKGLSTTTSGDPQNHNTSPRVKSVEDKADKRSIQIEQWSRSGMTERFQGPAGLSQLLLNPTSHQCIAQPVLRIDHSMLRRDALLHPLRRILYLRELEKGLHAVAKTSDAMPLVNASSAGGFSTNYLSRIVRAEAEDTVSLPSLYQLLGLHEPSISGSHYQFNKHYS